MFILSIIACLNTGSFISCIFATSGIRGVPTHIVNISISNLNSVVCEIVFVNPVHFTHHNIFSNLLSIESLNSLKLLSCTESDKLTILSLNSFNLVS